MRKTPVECNIQRVTELAQAQGRTLAHLCSLLGRPRSFLSDIRNGKTHMCSTELSIIAAALDTTPEYLTGQTDDPSAVSPLVQQVLDALDGLTDEQIGMVLAFITGLKA